MTADTIWTHTHVREWVDRHGGNVTACARRLGVARSALQTWFADPDTASSARPLPVYMQRLMEAIDQTEEDWREW